MIGSLRPSTITSLVGGLAPIWAELGSVDHCVQPSCQDRSEKERSPCIHAMEGCEGQIRAKCQDYPWPKVWTWEEPGSRRSVPCLVVQTPWAPGWQGLMGYVIWGKWSQHQLLQTNTTMARYVAGMQSPALQEWELFRVWDSCEFEQFEGDETEHHLSHNATLNPGQTATVMWLGFMPWGPVWN